MIKIIPPQSKLLQDYVAYFYVFNKTHPEPLHYIAFPHIHTSIALFKGVSISRAQESIIIQQSEGRNDEGFCVEILGKYTQPVFVQYEGLVQEISIIFKPFGVNSFLPADLIQYAPAFSQALRLDNWDALCREVFEAPDEVSSMERIETFLLSNLNPIQHPILHKALKMLGDFEQDYSIQDIADACGISMKSMQRDFKKLMTCSPAAYRRIARFRHSLSYHGLSKEIKKLTDVAYASNYYDQSYFIKEYKKLSGLNPKDFFKRITALNQKEVIWDIR